MFIEENKPKVEKELLEAVNHMIKYHIPKNWEEVIVVNDYFGRAYRGHFFVIFTDGTFIESGTFYHTSKLLSSVISHFTLNFAKIGNAAFDYKTTDPINYLNIMTLRLSNTGNVKFDYYENLNSFGSAGTVPAAWEYKLTGYKRSILWSEEVDKFIEAYNIIPERKLQLKEKVVDLRFLVETVMYKSIPYISPYLTNKMVRIYFHLDTICNKKKMNIYIEYKDKTWLKERNVQAKFAGTVDFRIVADCWDWIQEVDSIKYIRDDTYKSLDYIYDISTGELSYVYDNVTEDNFTDELALVNAWEERYFSPDGEPLLTHAIAPHEGCITGTMHIDMSQFIEEEEEEMVNVDSAKEFTGEDIHDLIPRYLQNSYDILYSILPGTYQRVYLYVENDGTVCRQLGYIIVDGEYLTFEEMVDREVVSKATYDATMEQLALWSNYMRNAFIACHLEPWTVFSYMLDEEMHISNNFGYDVLAEQAYENELFDLWSYEKLGIKSSTLPEDKIKDIVPENEYVKF